MTRRSVRKRGKGMKFCNKCCKPVPVRKWKPAFKQTVVCAKCATT